MRRHEDILRILSSVLLGTLVRDFERLSDHLRDFFLSHNSPFFSSHAENIATVTIIVLIGVYLRNIHASARWDDFVEKSHLTLKIDRKLRWRISSFILALLSLIGAPVAGHIIGYHLPTGGSIAWMVWPLFLPLAVYVIWDAVLFLSDPEPSSDGTRPQVEEIARKWVFIDALGLALVTVLLGIKLYLEGKPNQQQIPPEVVAVGFVLIATGIVITDYLWNHRLYFPFHAAKVDTPAKDETDQHLERKIAELKTDTKRRTEALARLTITRLQRQQEDIDRKLDEIIRTLNNRRSPLKMLGQFLMQIISRR